MPFRDPIDTYQPRYGGRQPSDRVHTILRKLKRNGKTGKRFFRTRGEFLAYAEKDGAVFQQVDTDRLVEFIRPCSDHPKGFRMRVRDIRSGAKFNVDYLDLHLLNEMEVIARMADTEEAEG